MKMKKELIFMAGLCLLATSCVQNSKEYLQLKAQNDSIRTENQKYETQMNDMLSLLNDIETNFQSMRDAENYLNIQQSSGVELTPSTRDRIKGDMMLISETLKKNKEQLDQLQTQLKNSNIRSAALQKTIVRISAELDQKAALVVSLQQELSKKNLHIDELDKEVASLKDDVEDLSTTNESQKKTLATQDKALNRGYYCFGTSKELKDQKILTGGGIFAKSKVLKGDFNRDYFIPVDIRDLKDINLYTGKAKLLSNHPAGSYTFNKDADGNLIFHISDYKSFWSLGRYLVIEVE
ncbi:MAG: hypothetical protein LBL81_04650 [Tannerella sp.]|jgi:uncharacterized small protein (DUF1192 family)|nr:hypothetical protein [Tannerella sp.]